MYLLHAQRIGSAAAARVNRILCQHRVLPVKQVRTISGRAAVRLEPVLGGPKENGKMLGACEADRKVRLFSLEK
jgi:hypothetical protein